MAGKKPAYSSRGKTVRRRRGGNNRRSNPRPSVNLMPERMSSKISFLETVSLVLLTSSGTNLSYRGNSLFDPDAGVGIALQPTGFSTMTAFYSRYCVISSSITVIVVNLGLEPGTFVLLPSFDNNVYGFSAYRSNDMSKVSYFTGASAGGSIVTLRANCSTRTIFGGNSLTDPDTEALVSANPAKQWYWKLYLGTMESVSTTVNLDIKIVYNVEWRGRKINV